MFLDSVVHLTELLVLLLTGLMIRRMLRLYRVRAAFEPTSPVDQADPALSAARPVAFRNRLPVAPTPTAAMAPSPVPVPVSSPAPSPAPEMELASYIDELFGFANDTDPAIGSALPTAPATRLIRSPLPNDRRQPTADAGGRPEPAYQPVATILSRRCDRG